MSLVGTRLGAYEVVALIGVGGMGEVYRARDTKLGRDVAVKALPAAVAIDRERLARFEREARLLASLNHPNIAQIYELEDGIGRHGQERTVPVIVMELVDGETLADRIARGPVAVDNAIAVARQIADALDAAHERGIVHRDLKPSNIAITDEGTVKVLDFGLAKDGAGTTARDLTHSPTVIEPTVDGVLLGTAPYMSPEQARGRPVDKRTDVWAFGCVLYEMLTGRRAFTGETPSDAIASILGREPDWTTLPASTPPSIVRLLHRCLEKDVKRRQRDIGDARADLDVSRDVSAAADGGAATRGWQIVAVIALLAFGAASAVAVWYRARSSGASRMWTTQTIASTLTNYGGHERDGALSPDGRSFVFASDHGGTPDIWLRQVSGGEPVRLTNDAADESSLAFAPDGETVYFTRTEGTDVALWRVGVLGGQSRKVLTAPRLFAPSPDGRSLAFYETANASPDGRSSLIVSAIDGSGRRTIARDVLTSNARPAWAPDSRRVSFVRGGLFAPSNLFVVDAAGGDERQITRFEGNAGIQSHAWLPDGRHLVVSYVPFARQQPPHDLGVIDLDDGSLTRLTLSGNDQINSLNLSADGSRLMATSVHIQGEVWKASLGPDPDANGRGAIRLMDSSRDPMWTFVSRDGRTLLFNSPASGSRNLWTWPLDGSTPPRQVTAIGQDTIAHSSLSPDGSRVAFASTAGGSSDIWTQNVDGTELRQLTNDAAADSWPVWSPDGRSIVFSSLRVTPETWRVPADGGPAEKLMDGFFRGDWVPAVEGEGTRIVTSDGGNSVRLIDVERKTVLWRKRLGGDSGSLSLPLFSPDRRRIALPIAENRSRDVIWILDAGTGEGRVAVRFADSTQIFFRASWVDNGNALVFNAYQTRTHIQLFDRFWSPTAIDRQ